MKTDSFFHRFFREFLEAFFTLIGEEEQKAKHYEFTSVEVKEQSFRFDGVVQPASREDRLYFFEAQFKHEDDFYLRFFGEVAVFLRQKKPENLWRAVVLFPTEAFDPGIHPHYQEFFESGRICRLYLTGIPEERLEKFPLNLLRIIIDSDEKVLASAEKIIRQLPEQVPDARTQEVIVDLLINLLLSKLPQMSRKEIEKMFEPLLSDVKKSRFYQEVAEEVAQELTPKIAQELTPKIAQELTPKIAQESKYEIAKAMLKKNFTIELIAEITGLPQDEIRALSQQMTDGKQ
ncbi:Rpn family recombination-promoting nuclease/putative transposase [candidate division KSB1 bacterium]|nr:Rpn family recombination-promoting nuclease/putative transposase [candidate division KSB1 bacterium]